MSTSDLHKSANGRLIALSALLLALVCLLGVVHAVTPAGSIIKNQASASYRDTQGVQRIATSNLVETVIRQVAAIELTLNQTKPGASGQEIFFTHTLLNSGNGDDQYNLTALATEADFRLLDISIYPDADRDGQPDSYISIATSPWLQAGESWGFVIAGQVPSDARDGDSGIISVSAASAFNASVSAINQDVAVVTDSAVVEISKQINGSQGTSSNRSFTVRIQYKNTSAVPATAVTVIDALPSGVDYIAGSGRWSDNKNGAGIVDLTDADPADSQSGIRYCAYNASCVGLPEASADSDADSTNQVTAIVESVAAGESGFVEFSVSIAADQPSVVLSSIAELHYSSAGNQIGPINSNAVPYTITASAGVVINGSITTSVDGTDEPREKLDSVFGAGSNLPPCQSATSDPDGDGFGTENSTRCVVQNLQAGNSLFYRNTVWNTGFDTDAFDLTTVASSFPANTVFRLLKADGQTPLLDTNGNGVPDTGPIPSGEAQEIVLQVVLPVGAKSSNGTTPFGVTTVATSVADNSVSNTMLNLLQNITSSSVVISNSADVNDPVSSGLGSALDAVTSLEVVPFEAVPGNSVDIPLVINNIGVFPMEYSLAASTSSDFTTIELPDQWQLQFLIDDSTGGVSAVSSTGVIAEGDFIGVIARVTVPLQVAPSITNLYFRVANEQASAIAIKREVIEIKAVQALLSGINQEGQAQAGGTRVYNHTLANTGNIDINNIALSVTDSLSGEGWTSVIYEDTDSNGTLSSADQVIDTISLATNETSMLFVKVYVPGSSGDGISNLTELTASSASGTLSVDFITNVSAAKITMLKEQALDLLCDGVLESNYSSGGFDIEPGNNCVRYRLTSVNSGSEPVLNVVVADATPIFTSYTGNAVCSQVNCTVTEPADGSNGDIIAELPSLAAGDSVVVEFMVRVD